MSPSRSRVRCNGCLLSWTRLRPEARISASSSWTRAPSTTSARRIAASAPARTNAESVTPRNDFPVAAHPTASSRLVLPWAFAPEITVTPGGNRSVASS